MTQEEITLQTLKEEIAELRSYVDHIKETIVELRKYVDYLEWLREGGEGDYL